MCRSGGGAARLPAGGRHASRRPRRSCASSTGCGDYQHKARNRMKFLIKTLGWDAFQRRVPAVRSRRSSRREIPPLPFDPDASARGAVAGLGAIAGTSGRRDGGSVEAAGHAWPRHSSRAPAGAPCRRRGPARLAAARTCAASASRDTCRVTISLPLGDLTAAQLRVLVATLAGAYGDGTARLTIDQDLVVRWIPESRLEAFYAATGRRRPWTGRGRARDQRHQLPGRRVVPPGGDAVARARTHPARHSGRPSRSDRRGARPGRQDQRLPERMRTASPRGRGVPGQHPEGRRPGRAAVLRAGGRRRRAGTGRPFGRLAAKIPARRAPAALERLIGLYQQQRQRDEGPTAFFRRVALDVVKATLADLEPLTEETARPEDFIDLGETEAYSPEVMDGECSV